MNHEAASLPDLVQNLVKNWEVEASFKPKLDDWRTIDHENYSFAINSEKPQGAENMLKVHLPNAIIIVKEKKVTHITIQVGTYNAIISPNEYYDPTYSDFASSHKTFKRMMPTFAWEVLEVYSGPPTVAFRWRHWGVMKNDYVGFNNKGEKVTAKAHGGPIDIEGVTVATVNDKVQLQSVRTWFDPMDMFRQIAPDGVVKKEEMNKNVSPADALEDAQAGVEVPKEQTLPDRTVQSASEAKEKVAEIEDKEARGETTGMPSGHPSVEGGDAGGCPFMAQGPR